MAVTAEELLQELEDQLNYDFPYNYKIFIYTDLKCFWDRSDSTTGPSGMADSQELNINIIESPKKSTIKHEIAHILAFQLWGNSAYKFYVEGFAVWQSSDFSEDIFLNNETMSLESFCFNLQIDDFEAIQALYDINGMQYYIASCYMDFLSQYYGDKTVFTFLDELFDKTAKIDENFPQKDLDEVYIQVFGESRSQVNLRVFEYYSEKSKEQDTFLYD